MVLVLVVLVQVEVKMVKQSKLTEMISETFNLGPINRNNNHIALFLQFYAANLTFKQTLPLHRNLAYPSRIAPANRCNIGRIGSELIPKCSDPCRNKANITVATVPSFARVGGGTYVLL